MEDLEKKLSSFKQHRLSRRADWKIRFRLYQIIIKQKASSFFDAFNLGGLSINSAALVALLVIFVVSSTSFYAYGSEQVTPGKVLYPLKRTIEVVKNELSPTGAAKADNYNGLSSRRLDEALILSDQDKTKNNEEEDKKLHNNISATIERAVENYTHSVENMDKINNEERQNETVDKLKISGDDNIRVLEEIENNIDFEKNPELNHKISEAKERIKERREYLDRDRNKKNEDDDKQNNFNEDKRKDENKEIKVEEGNVNVEEPEQGAFSPINSDISNENEGKDINLDNNESDEDERGDRYEDER